MQSATFYPDLSSDQKSSFQSLLDKVLPGPLFCKDQATFELQVLESVEEVLHNTLLNKEIVTDCYNLLFNSPIDQKHFNLKNLYEVARQVRDLYAYFTEKTRETKIFKSKSTSPTIVYANEKPLFLAKQKHKNSYFRLDNKQGIRREHLHYLLFLEYSPNHAFVPPTFRLEGGITLQTFIRECQELTSEVGIELSFWNKENVRDIGWSRLSNVYLDESRSNYLVSSKGHLISIDGSLILPPHLEIGPVRISPLLTHPILAQILNEPFTPAEIKRFSNFDIGAFSAFLEGHEIEEEACRIASCAMEIVKRAITYRQDSLTLRDLLVIFYVSDHNGIKANTLPKEVRNAKVDKRVAQFKEKNKRSPDFDEQKTIKRGVKTAQMRIFPAKETLFRSICFPVRCEVNLAAKIDAVFLRITEIKSPLNPYQQPPTTQPDKSIFQYYHQ